MTATVRWSEEDDMYVATADGLPGYSLRNVSREAAAVSLCQALSDELLRRQRVASDVVEVLTRRVVSAEDMVAQLQDELEVYRAKEEDSKARRAKLLELQRQRLARKFQGDVMSAPHDEPQF